MSVPGFLSCLRSLAAEAIRAQGWPMQEAQRAQRRAAWLPLAAPAPAELRAWAAQPAELAPLRAQAPPAWQAQATWLAPREPAAEAPVFPGCTSSVITWK